MPCSDPQARLDAQGARSDRTAASVIFRQCRNRRSIILLNTETLAIRDVVCLGRCRHKSARECAASTNLVFPYPGLFVRHAGRQEAVADANQLLFFNAAEDYCVSHPVEGGDACLSLIPRDHVLEELAPKDQLARGERVAFRCQNRRLTAKAQLLAAQLRHARERERLDPWRQKNWHWDWCGRRWANVGRRAKPTPRRRKLVDRVKLVLASDPARRWTLAGIGAEVGGFAGLSHPAFPPSREINAAVALSARLETGSGARSDYVHETISLAWGVERRFLSSHSHFTFAFRRA